MYIHKSELSSSRVNSNLNGTRPIDDNKRHEGFSVNFKDYNGHLIDVDEDDFGYIEHARENSGSLEIRSEDIGKKLFPAFQDHPLIVEISIEYCPICGRELGITPTDT